MSLASQLTLAFQAVGGAIKALRTQDMPSYAPTNLVHTWDARHHVLNANARTLRRYLLAVGRSLEGVSATNILSIGDSSGRGYNGATYDTTKAMPRQMALVIAMAAGLPLIDGVSLANAGSGLDEKWVLSGGGGSTSYTNYPDFVTLTAAGYLEHTSAPGTTAMGFYSDLSAPFTYQIDNGAAVPVTPGGTATYKAFTVPNLTPGPHKIRFNWVSGTVYVGAAWGMTPGRIGIVHHNCCIGGTFANMGATFLNWSTTDTTGPQFLVKQIMALVGVTPDLLTIQVGGNDHAQASPATTTIAGVANMAAFYACDVATIRPYMLRTYDPVTYADLAKRQLAAADANGWVHFDWNDFSGGADVLYAAGALGADGYHAKHQVNIEAGRNFGEVLAFGANTPSSKAPVQLISAATYLQTGMVYRADTTAGAFPAYLPAAPEDGVSVTIDNVAVLDTSPALTVTALGADTFDNGATTAVLNPAERGMFRYRSTGAQWVMQRDLSAATPATNVRRNNAGQISVGTPTLAGHAANKDYIDTTAGTSAATGSTLARRNAFGQIDSTDPTAAAHLTTKNYVDTVLARRLPAGVGNVASGLLIQPWNVLSTAAASPGNQQLGLFPIDIGPNPQTIASVAFQVVVALAGPNGSATATLVLYKDDGTGSGPLVTAPGTLLSSNVLTLMQSTGLKTVALSATLLPGRYWAGLLWNQGGGSPTTAATLIAATNGTTLHGPATAIGANRLLLRTGLTTAPTDGVAFGPNTTSTCPVVALKAA